MTARCLLSQDDLAGVAVLAYQAFESAMISLNSVINGSDSRTHATRRKRAKILLSNHRTKINWSLQSPPRVSHRSRLAVYI